MATTDPTYVKAEIEARPDWRLAFLLSEVFNDNAPIGWSHYVRYAAWLLSRLDADGVRALYGEVVVTTPTCHGGHGAMRLVLRQWRCETCGSIDELADVMESKGK